VVLPIADISTERLALRPLAVSDAEDMLAVLADPNLYEFIGGNAPDLATLRDRYRRQLTGPGRDGESWLNWIVRTATDGRAVGFVQASVLDRSADVAWLVGTDHQGMGIATEATRAMCDWLFGSGIDRLEAHVDPLHAASRAVAQRIGMSPTGESDDDGEEIWARDRPDRA
jgi:RimJ/RimL family protein N-acetyltransferase